MKTEGIHHIVVFVKDIEKAGEFYSQLLGAEFKDFDASEEVGLRIMISRDGGVELLMPINDQTDLARSLKERGEGLYTVAFKVIVEEARAWVAEKGFRITGEFDSGFEPDWVEIMLHTEDTHGVPIILTGSR
ncbi:VOC family protein [Chloroflexota bacterium]